MRIIVVSSQNRLSNHEIKELYYNEDNDLFTVYCYCGFHTSAKTIEECIKRVSKFDGYCDHNTNIIKGEKL